MSTPSSNLWTSKLGNKYPKEEIERMHDRTMKELIELRRTNDNALCADCGDQGTVWSSVNLGVFLCLHCGSLHRALGTHISKPKGTTGTYLWGPDELNNMKTIGNARAKELYGGINERPPRDAPSSVWLEYIRQKYEDRKFAPPERAILPETNSFNTNAPSSTPHASVPTGDLIDLSSNVKPDSDPNAFFAEFGL